MDRVSADSKVPRLFGRFDDVVCAIDRTTGSFKSIPVGAEPHGPWCLAAARALFTWPTGNMR